MSQPRDIRSYDYVNRPYSTVRDALVADPVAVFRAATVAAASRGESVAAELRVEIGGVHLGTEITPTVGTIEQSDRHGASQATRIPIEWKAAHRPRWFPLMSAVLSVYPLTATETQLDFLGHYDPPLGAVGGAIDALVGHRIAEACVHRFVADIAHHLRTGGTSA